MVSSPYCSHRQQCHQARRKQAAAGGGERGDDRPQPQLRLPQAQGGGRREAKVLLPGG